ncbi:MAG TPA: dihydroorotate dehydrogenase electron transfer subunit [Desulfobulbaceae bacterium]|nr:dihydroorotate dehydrogenase electron transfer subunit [Desulfobulbaceae bacterium]
MPEFQEKSPLLHREVITADIFRLTLHAPEISRAAHPGQFVMLQINDGMDPLLRRPFSIHQVSAGGNIQILFKVVGRGTAQLAGLLPGHPIDCIGPLGRGFALEKKDRLCLVGGGMGLAPLYFLAGRLLQTGKMPEKDFVLLGARNREELSIFADEFSQLGYPVQTATDDGSMGHHGFVTELLDPILPGIQRVYTCGPSAMMKICADKACVTGVGCQVSLETHMACGLGACLGCAVTGADESYLHVCRQGPVFDAGEVAWTR